MHQLAPQGAICPYCTRRMLIGKRDRSDPLARTKDHILPRGWGGNSNPSNIRFCCRRCNELRASAGHCHAVLMLAWSVARDTKHRPEDILRRWKLYQYQWLPGRRTA